MKTTPCNFCKRFTVDALCNKFNMHNMLVKQNHLGKLFTCHNHLLEIKSSIGSNHSPLNSNSCRNLKIRVNLEYHANPQV